MSARALSTFHPSRILLLGVAVATLVAMPATAQVAQQGRKAQKLTWMKAPPSLPAGAMMAVVSGDPTKSGQFEIELSLPNGYTVAPH